MRTDQLIDMLSTNVEPIERRRVPKGVGLAVAVAGAAALVVGFFGLGVRPDLANPDALGFLLLKIGFAAGVVTVASMFLMRLACPGGERRTRPWLALLPFIGVVIVAAVSLAAAPRSHWDEMLIGEMWVECVVSIPIIALVPFAVIVWAVRQLAAPTDLARTGAFVGLVAGGVSAMGYALHCMDDSVPFIALWYGGTIALCTLAGAVLGPRLLRW